MKAALQFQRVSVVDVYSQDKENQLRGCEYFSFLFSQLEQYQNKLASNTQSQKINRTIADHKNENIRLSESINNTLEAISVGCVLQEDEKIDCLEQSLKIMRKIHEINIRRPRTQLTQNEVSTSQMQITIVQKLSEIILKVLMPKDMTLKTLLTMSKVIIHKLMECESPISYKQNQNDKKKKPVKKNKKATTDYLEYSLVSGKKIDLAWFLIFRFLQANLERTDMQQEDNYESNDNGSHLSLLQFIDQKVIRFIREFIKQLLMEQFFDYNLTHILLKNIVKHINEIQLPILPFILNVQHQILMHKFSLNYELLRSNQSDHNVFNREIFSLENIMLLTELIPRVADRLMSYEAAKEVVTCVGICSYCGVRKSNQRELLVYQRVTIKMQEDQNIVIRICEPCCLQLGLQPTDNPNILLFGPLILSRYWNEISAQQLSNLNISLHRSLLYHFVTAGKKKNQRERTQVQLFQKIAMNNADQNVVTKLIEAVYNYFMFEHSRLSIKKIICTSIELLTVFSNDKNDKIREKIVKFVNHSHHVVSFLLQPHFNQGEHSEELQKVRDKFFTSIEFRLRDSIPEVRLASLDLLLQIYSRGHWSSMKIQQFYSFIFYEQIVFFENEGLMIKSFDIIDKFIVEKAKMLVYKGQKQIIPQYVRVILQVLKFAMDCINRYNSDKNESKQPLKQRVYKLINKILAVVEQVSQLQFEEDGQIDILRHFNKYLNCQEDQLRSITNIAEVHERILLQTSKQIKFDSLMMSNIPLVTRDLIKKMVYEIDNTSNSIGLLLIIEQNIISLIDMVYDTTIQYRKHIMNVKSVKQSTCRLNLKDITYYLKSSTFIEILIEVNQSSEIKILSENNKDSVKHNAGQLLIPNSIKMNILTHLISLNNMAQIISKQAQILHYMNLWLKISKRQSETKDNNTIILNEKLSLKMQRLSSFLFENIRICNLDQIQVRGKLLVDYSMYTGQADSITMQITNYQKYSRNFLRDLLVNLQNYKSIKDEQILNQIMKNYQWIMRCMSIITTLTTNLQKYLVFNHAILQLKAKDLNRLLTSSNNRKSLSKSKQIQKDQNVTMVIQSSNLFNTSYALLLQILQLEEVPQNQNIAQVIKKLMDLLSRYWKVHPNVIFISKKLLQNITTKINESTLIKDIYKLFLELLPCNNIRILSVINSTFDKTFHSILNHELLRMDDQLIALSFKILFHMLKSGMTGLYDFNKYIFYGLMHRCLQVNELIIDIILKIYAHEASEKIIFMNLSQSFKFVYQIQFQHQDVQNINFSDKQKKNMQILSSITKLKSKVVLARERKQLKLQVTLMKKIGEYLSQQITLLKQNPKYLFFIIKIIQTQTMFDYSELNQIIFSVNKIVNNYYHFIQKLRQCVQEHQQITQLGKDKIFDILIVYRQVISCLAFLCSYKRIDSQIKNYNHLVDSSPNLYVNLKQEIYTQKIESENNQNEKIQIIFDDIDLFFDIIKGETHHFQIQKTQHSSHDDSQEYSDLTVKTKIHKRSKLPQKDKLGKEFRHKIQSLSQQKPKIGRNTNICSFKNYKGRLRDKKQIQYNEEINQSDN